MLRSGVKCLHACATSAVVAVVASILASVALAQDPNVCDMPGEEPDVIVGDIPAKRRHGSSNGITAFSVATVSCNVGTCWLKWLRDTNEHPVIGQNMFRLKDGRFEQIGQSWLKHGFNALSQELCSTACIGTNGTHLGVNCADTYGANTNGTQTSLGPKFEVNPSTGVFPYPATDLSQTGNSIYKRLQIHNTDLNPALNPGALYFVEAQYVTADDAAAENDDNNASWRRLTVTDSNGVYDIVLQDSTQREQPAIHAWQVNDPAVVEANVDVPGDGRFILAARASDLGGGQWRYEYAIQNLNSERAARSFRLAVPPGANVTNIGFHDVDYHSGEPFDGTDWVASLTNNIVTWTTESHAQNPGANALRWGTLYNYRFDADVAPDFENGAIGLFKPGGPGAPAGMLMSTLGPALASPSCDLYDEDGDTIGNPCDNCPALPNTGQEDTDTDRVGDACDECPGTIAGAAVDEQGCPQVPGDANRDGDLDLEDFGTFQICLTGTDIPQTDPDCAAARLDTDEDVDGDDLLLFLGCLSGAGVPGNVNCRN